MDRNIEPTARAGWIALVAEIGSEQVARLKLSGCCMNRTDVNEWERDGKAKHHTHRKTNERFHHTEKE